MKLTPILSAANPLIKKVRSLTKRSQRQKSGLFLIEGAKLVSEALAKGVAITQVIVSQSCLKQGLGDCHAADLNEVVVVDDRLFQELSTTESAPGILAVGKMPAHGLEEVFKGQRSLVVIADAIQDPGNLGSMIRTALAASASGMVLLKGTVDPYNPKVVRSAAGALFALPVVTDLTLAETVAAMKERGLAVIACDPGSHKPFWEADFRGPVAIAFGNEGQGFSPAALALADAVVTIPMDCASESLNVAVSAGIILFCCKQQRQTDISFMSRDDEQSGRAHR